MASQELNSRSYILSINRSSLKPDIYTLFLNRIATTVSDPLNRKVWIFETYNDYCRKSDNYPVIVIESPSVPTNTLTFNKKRINGRIELVVYSKTKKQSDLICSQIINTILDGRSYFRKVGITEIELEDDDSDFEKINEQVGRHSGQLIFSFKYIHKIAW